MIQGWLLIHGHICVRGVKSGEKKSLSRPRDVLLSHSWRLDRENPYLSPFVGLFQFLVVFSVTFSVFLIELVRVVPGMPELWLWSFLLVLPTNEAAAILLAEKSASVKGEQWFQVSKSVLGQEQLKSRQNLHWPDVGVKRPTHL